MLHKRCTVSANISQTWSKSKHRLWTQTNGLLAFCWFCCWCCYKKPLLHELKVIFFTFPGECLWWICGENVYFIDNFKNIHPYFQMNVFIPAVSSFLSVCLVLWSHILFFIGRKSLQISLLWQFLFCLIKQE